MARGKIFQDTNVMGLCQQCRNRTCLFQAAIYKNNGLTTTRAVE